MSVVRPPEVCSRCRGEEWLWVNAYGPVLVEVPCPDCCCPCAQPTGGGLCERCGAEDFVYDDAVMVRRADR